jgi:hypothetical protein
MYDRIDGQGISDYFDKGVREGYKYLVIYSDSFSYDYFPVLFKDAEEFWEARDELLTGNTWESMEEVYDLSLNKEDQMNEFRAKNFPPRPTPKGPVKKTRKIKNKANRYGKK